MILATRNWVPPVSETRVQEIAQKTAYASSATIAARVQSLAKRNAAHK